MKKRQITISNLLTPFFIYGIKFIFKHPRLKFKLLFFIKDHPYLFGWLRRFLKNQNILIHGAGVKKVVNPVITKPLLGLYSSSARQVYQYLQAAVSNLSKGDYGKPIAGASTQRLTLALVSPLPPQRTGIANYTAALLPELAKYYDVEIIAEPGQVDDYWKQSGYSVRTPDWLCENFYSIDRVIYQMGNSIYHYYMLSLMENAPGIVVLHDFYLSGLFSYLELDTNFSNIWTQELYHSHGYRAVKERFQEIGHAIIKYPVNLKILQQAVGVVVHSEYSRQLAQDWYGVGFANNWQTIPLLQQIIPTLPNLNAGLTRENARRLLGLKGTDFVICSFGFLDPVKLNHRLCEAWRSSTLSQHENIILIFVGENHSGHYGRELLNYIRQHNLVKRIRITGWVELATFQAYLMAADMAVQLRTQSRGETSGAITDCMQHGLPVITNANGAFAYLPPDAVWLMPDDFSNAELAEALETLYSDQQRRTELGRRARDFNHTHHSPANCAHLYMQAIEKFYASAIHHPALLAKQMAQTLSNTTGKQELVNISNAAAGNLPALQGKHQFLVDISATCRNQLKTGIERMVHCLLLQLLESPPVGYRVEPVYLCEEDGHWHYKYARQYTLDLLNCPPEALQDELVEVHKGDLLLTLDWSGQLLIDSVASGLHAKWRARGVKIYAVIHDLLPLSLPQLFPPGAEKPYRRWLEAVAQFDGAVCVSQTVAAEFKAWLEKNGLNQPATYQITWSHHGADIESPVSITQKISNEELNILEKMKTRPSFLMVGTIEPRKGYLQVIEAFSLLWSQNIDVNLIIVGRAGWQHLPAEMRRNIPQTIHSLRTHSERDKRLFWLENADDGCLQKIYKSSTCLIMASYGEGFGLPLIEAAHYGLPVIARNLPIFCEIAGEHIYYFRGNDPINLADTIKSWLVLYESGAYPGSQSIAWLTWKEAAQKILQNLFTMANAKMI